MVRGVLAVTLAGCTSFFTQRVPSATGPHDPAVDCASIAWPIIDASFVAASVVAAAACASSPQPLGEGDHCIGWDLLLVPALVSTYSAGYGGVQYAACKLAQGDQRERRAHRLANP